jgi:hypothetical protein
LLALYPTPRKGWEETKMSDTQPASARRSAWVMAAGLAALGAAPASAYEETAVSDGATIQGKVTYGGAVPTKKIIPSDPEVCGQPRDVALIETDDEGGVTDAVVYLEEVARGKAWPEPAEMPELDNKDCRFRPQLVAMPPGPVVIVNTDPVLHNTHAFYGRRTAFNIGLPKQGLRIEKELRRPGIVRVECDEHGHMSARIFVAANPYYAATRDGGAFAIDAIPPGKYELVVYQEETGPVETEVELEGGETLTLDVDLAAKAFARR